MKRNPKLEKIRAKTPKELKLMIDHSFDIVDRIDEIMKRKDISQRQLAEMLNKSESEVSKWMRGTHNFTLKTIAKLETILGESIFAISSKKPSLYIFQFQDSDRLISFAVRGTSSEINNTPKDFQENKLVDIGPLCEQLN